MGENFKPIADLIPLREPTFYILLALSNEKKHGYAILKNVETLSHGRVRLSTGTLYGALGRLLDQGLICRILDEDSGNKSKGTRPRKYYILTKSGKRLLGEEISRLEGLLATARTQIGEETL